MLTLFGSKKHRLLGIDIGSTAVRLLGMSKSASGYTVDSYAVEPLPAGAVVEQDIVDVEMVGDAIARLVAKAQPATKRAAVAVPVSTVITKIIEMDAHLSEDDREMELRLEADQHIPFPVDEIRMDFQVLEPLERNPERVNVLLVASRIEHVELRADALEIGGLKPVVVDVEPYAIERTFNLLSSQLPAPTEGALVAIFDIGSVNSVLHVLQAGRTVYTREQAYGSGQLIEEIQRRYGLSLEEAAIAQRSGDLPDDYATEVLAPFKEKLIQQIDRSLQLFFSSTQFDAVDQLLLAGSVAATEGLLEQTAETLELPCIVANPLEQVTLGNKVSANVMANDASSLLVACGLAMHPGGGAA